MVIRRTFEPASAPGLNAALAAGAGERAHAERQSRRRRTNAAFLENGPFVLTERTSRSGGTDSSFWQNELFVLRRTRSSFGRPVVIVPTSAGRGRCPAGTAPAA